MADSTSLAFGVLSFPPIAKLLGQDAAFSTKTLAAREVMLTPSRSASLVMLVMPVMGRFRSSGPSALAAAGTSAGSASGCYGLCTSRTATVRPSEAAVLPRVAPGSPLSTFLSEKANHQNLGCCWNTITLVIAE